MQSSGELLYDQIDEPCNRLEKKLNRCLYNKAGVRWPANDQLRNGLQMWQVMNHEVDCEEYVDDIPGPVVEFRVKSGRVTMKEPRSVLKRQSHGDESQFMKIFMQGG